MFRNEENTRLLGVEQNLSDDEQENSSPETTSYLKGNKLRLSCDEDEYSSASRPTAPVYFYAPSSFFPKSPQDSKDDLYDLDKLELTNLQQQLQESINQKETITGEARIALDTKLADLLARQKAGGRITEEEDPYNVTGICGWGNFYDDKCLRCCMLPCCAATCTFGVAALCIGVLGPTCCNVPFCCTGAYFCDPYVWETSGFIASTGAGACFIQTGPVSEYKHYKFYQDLPADKAEQISRLAREIVELQQKIEVVEERIASKQSPIIRTP